LLHKLRSRLGFPGTVALVALFVALGGPSLAEPVHDAARSLVTGKQIKRGAIDVRHLSRRARNALRGEPGATGAAGADGAAGATGPPGANGQQGLQGLPGAPGAPGADAASAFIGAFSYNPPSPLQIAAATGVSTALQVGSEAGGAQLYVGAPSESMLARELRVDAVVTGGSVRFALRVLRADGSPPADLLFCTIGAGEDACDSGVQEGTIDPGDFVYMLATGTGATGDGQVRFGWRATEAP
jgi:hypothetical protein